MNDFTKEELEYLAKAIYDRPNCITQEMEIMRHKIQSMIDNYCEHEFSILPAPHFLMMCSKCDKTIVGDDFPG